MAKRGFEGCLTALITPFLKGAIDGAALTALIEAQIEGGVDGLVPCGTTGEYPTLTQDEWLETLKITVAVSKGRLPVIAGCGTNSTAQTVKCAQLAQGAGVDGLLVVSPYYNRPAQAGIYRHFEAVAKAVDLPIIVYNIPSRTGGRIAPETFVQLAQLPTIVGCKEASGDMTYLGRCLAESQGQITFLSGDDPSALAFIGAGGRGAISVASNLMPALCRDWIHRAMVGDWQGAQKLNQRLIPLFDALALETNPIPVKAAFEALGWSSGDIRLPMTPLDPSLHPTLLRALKTVGLMAKEA